ncbi:MAG: YggS family pyridoxal phosphate-dependent enzyme [Pseudomonadota bacterium]
MSVSASDIAANLEDIRARMHAAATAAGRDPDGIRLIAVSKYMPADYVRMAMAAGQFCFGESTVQDAQTKQALLDDRRTEWHFIGHLQSNKARFIPGRFAWLHTLDSLRLAQRLSAAALDAAHTVQVLIQVNVAADPAKQGLAASELFSFVDRLLAADLAGIRLRGLMTIGRHDADTEPRRAEFAALRELGRACAERFGAPLFCELSMGMSADFELAITEGATMVRVGSSIFGAREKHDAGA